MRAIRRISPNIQRVGVVFLLSLPFCGCSQKSGNNATQPLHANAVPGGSPFADSIQFEYAVYLLPGNTDDPSRVLRVVMSREYPTLRLVDKLPQQAKVAVVHAHLQKNVIREYPPPRLESLQYFGRGITREQGMALQKSDKAFILDFAHPKRDVWTALRTANALVEEIARKTGGLVWDEETREVFSPDAWQKKRLSSWTQDVPETSTQTTIHAYNQGEYVRAITLGMSKMGLPDVVVQEFPWSSNNQVGNLINLFCQALAEGKPLGDSGTFKLDVHTIKDPIVRNDQIKWLKSNATGVACLTLNKANLEEGDAQNRLIELAADSYPGSDPHIRQDLMLSMMFGWDDAATPVHHNQEILDESARERRKLAELQKSFAAGLQPGEFIQVKAPFATPNGDREWMWVEISGWKGDKIKGLLENEPFNIKSLHAGQKVEVRQEEVFDYIHEYPNKTTEGNTTAALLGKLSEGRETKPTVRPNPVDCKTD